MLKTFIAAFSIAAAVALPAWAQQQPQEQQPQEQQAQEQQAQEQQGQQAQLSSEADNIVGKKAMTSQGKEVGSIEDVLVGQDGRVQAMILDHDGKKRAVPWNQVSMQGDQVTVKLSEQQMSQLPEYKGEKE